MILSYRNTALQYLDPVNELRFALPEKTTTAVAANNYARYIIPYSREAFLSNICYLPESFMQAIRSARINKVLKPITEPVDKQGTILFPIGADLTTVFYNMTGFDKNGFIHFNGTIFFLSKKNAILEQPFIYYAQRAGETNKIVHCIDDFLPKPLSTQLQIVELLSLILFIEKIGTLYRDIPVATKENSKTLELGNETSFTIQEAYLP